MHNGQLPTVREGSEDLREEVRECGAGGQRSLLIHDAAIQRHSYFELSEGQRRRPVGKIVGVPDVAAERGGCADCQQLNLQAEGLHKLRQL